MLFNSYTFLFLFLPVTVAGAFLLSRYRAQLAAPWLVLASLFFYGWWDPRYVVLLAGSIALNYCAGETIARRGGRAGGHAFGVLCAAVAANLAVLGYFKYAGFFIATVDALAGTGLRFDPVVLPLGISFFTFTQIAFLVDVYRAPVRYRFAPYALFVSYFPHLIAGPILHHREMMPQFAANGAYRLNHADLAAGITLLAIGLFKKTVLADGIAPYAGPVFEAAPRGYAPGSLEAWGAALAFGLQLYFDFSAYSDMAVGLSKMLGIRMPANFHSPYKAASIIEFWRRWHMTLSRFLRDYLYIPLGGNRHGALRRYASLAVTMLLGGLWHGAAWTFVAWGAVHGAFLMINHGWRALRGRLGSGPRWFIRAESALAGLLTFIAIFAAWVLFRAEDLPSAIAILRGMAGLNGHAMPASWLIEFGESARWIAGADLPGAAVREWVGTRFGGIDAGLPRGLAEGRSQGILISKAQLIWIAGLFAIVWLTPNTCQIMARAEAFITAREAPATVVLWRSNPGWAVATALFLVMSIASMTRVSEFLYFQF